MTVAKPACMGNRIKAGLLAKTAAREPAPLAADVAAALNFDVLAVVERGDPGVITHRFAHDRVQQAALAMPTQAAQSRIHARLGKLLMAEDSTRALKIAEHLSAGLAELDATDRLHLRRIALLAVDKSMQSDAYDAALRHVDATAAMRPEGAWATAPVLTFHPEMVRLKVACLLNRIPETEDRADVLLARRLDILQKVQVLELMILLNTSQLNYHSALDVGAQALQLLGVTLPLKPSMVRVRVLLLCPPAYFTSSTLVPLIALGMVQMSMRHEKTRRIMMMALSSLYRIHGKRFDLPVDKDENFEIWITQSDATSLACHFFYQLYLSLALLRLAPAAPVLHRARMRAKAWALTRLAADAPQTLAIVLLFMWQGLRRGSI